MGITDSIIGFRRSLKRKELLPVHCQGLYEYDPAVRHLGRLSH